MAQFTVAEWKRIDEELTANPGRYGFPERVYGSVLLGSFNVRKLGSSHGRTKRTWEFLARICKQFDLIAIQEVMDDLSGMRLLMELLDPEFEMIVSDKTGAFPGEPGLGERLAFIYNRDVVVRTEVATDITFDRSKILSTLIENRDKVHDALDPLVAYETSWRRGSRAGGGGNRDGPRSSCPRSWPSSARRSASASRSRGIRESIRTGSWASTLTSTSATSSTIAGRSSTR